jgi:hypothetical protein
MGSHKKKIIKLLIKKREDDYWNLKVLLDVLPTTIK